MTETVASQVRANDDMITRLDELRAKLDASRREVTSVREQLEASIKNKERAQAEVRKATEYLENIAIRAGVQPIGSREQNTESVITRLEELDRKLEVASGALALANREWDQLRAALHPLIPPHLTGLSLVEALPALLEANEKQIAELRSCIDSEREQSRAEWSAEHDRCLGLQHEVALRVTERDEWHSKYDAATSNRNEAEARAKAHSATIAEFANRCRELEGQAQRRDKLAAQRLKTFEDLQMRIVDVANEKFGPFPVMGIEDAISAIEQGCFFQSMYVEAGRKLFERAQAWNGGENAEDDGGITEAIEAFETEQKRVHGMREAGMARFYGAPVPEDDCQAGTCDCPSRPGTYDIMHKNDPGPSGAV